MRRLTCAALAPRRLLAGCARQSSVPGGGRHPSPRRRQLVDELIRRSPVKTDWPAENFGRRPKSTGGGLTGRAGGTRARADHSRRPDRSTCRWWRPSSSLRKRRNASGWRMSQAHCPEVVKRVSIIQGGKVTEQWVATQPWADWVRDPAAARLRPRASRSPIPRSSADGIHQTLTARAAATATDQTGIVKPVCAGPG